MDSMKPFTFRPFLSDWGWLCAIFSGICLAVKMSWPFNTLKNNVMFPHAGEDGIAWRDGKMGSSNAWPATCARPSVRHIVFISRLAAIRIYPLKNTLWFLILMNCAVFFADCVWKLALMKRFEWAPAWLQWRILPGAVSIIPVICSKTLIVPTNKPNIWTSLFPKLKKKPSPILEVFHPLETI